MSRILWRTACSAHFAAPAGPEKEAARKSVASSVSACLPSLQSSCILASFSDPEIMTIEKVSLARMGWTCWQQRYHQSCQMAAAPPAHQHGTQQICDDRMQPELKLDCSPVCKARSAHAAKLPITAISLLATPPACPPPQQPNTVNLSSRAGSGGDSCSFSSSVQSGDGGQQLSQWPAPAPSPPAAAKSPSQAGGSPVPAQCTTWKSQAAVVPPPDLKWSPTIERLIMNSTKQVEQRY